MGTAKLVDVARRAGVSVGTVSNVLNRPDQVRPATREKVEQAVRELGFVRNDSARQLRSGTSRLLAYVLPDARNPFFTDVARAAQERAREHDLALVLCDADSVAAQEDEFLALLLERRLRGALITSVDYTNPRLRELPGLGLPIVLVDHIEPPDSPIPSVGVDDIAGARAAVAHLIELGHRRIAFVGTPGSMAQVTGRHAGALAALGDAGLPEDALVVVETDWLSAQDGRRAAARILELPAEERPTAVFCANDMLALGVLQEASLRGLAVPDDLAIVGYDDIEFASIAAVPLPSVRQPRHDLGTIAVDLILAGDDVVDRHPVLQPELVVRASTAGRAAPTPAP